ncbi:MAG TPA: metallophosphoesterase [Actinomycetota bacterium]|nr:metallophosphoesterase [Actinomycetota bacterium]
MIRVAAVGDVHFGEDSAGTLQPHLPEVADCSDLLVLAGDLTRCGSADEAAVLAKELDGLPLPVFAVLGNHDYHHDESEAITGVLEQAGIRVLEGDAEVVTVGGKRVGVAGIKGFGGGFAGACGSDFGEPEMKAFVRHTKATAARLEEALTSLDTDVRICVLHYSPVAETLRGERLEIYPFLGSYLLAEAVDRAGADIVFHGHAHGGSEKGVTPGGVRVRNVAQPVIGAAFKAYCLGDDGHEEC